MRRLGACALLVILFMLAVMLPTSAEEGEQKPPTGFGDFCESLPPEVADGLPDSFFSDDMSEISDAVDEMTSLGYIWSRLVDALSAGLEGATGMLASLIGTVLLFSVARSFTSGREGAIGVVDMAVSASLGAISVGIFAERMAYLENYFTMLGGIMTGFVPLASGLMLSGGNIAGAGVANAGFLMWADMIELIANSGIIPGVSVCLAISLASSTGTAPDLSGISDMIKKTLSFLLGLSAVLMSSLLGAQSLLAARSDGASMRAARFVTGSMVPIVGGSVGDALKTLASGVSVLRATVGIGGVVAVGLLLLPTLVSVWLTGIAFSIAAAAARMLGSERQARLLRELGSLSGLMLSSAVIAAFLAMFSMAVFAMTSAAVGSI